MAVSQNPVPDGPRGQASVTDLHTLETRGLLHTPCRALSRGYKRLRIGGLVAPGARLLHTPCNGVCRVCGPWPCYKPLVLARSHITPLKGPIFYLMGTRTLNPEPSLLLFLSLAWASAALSSLVGVKVLGIVVNPKSHTKP